MKKLFTVLSILMVVCLCFAGCSSANSNQATTSASQSTANAAEETTKASDSENVNVLVVYYSFTGNTKSVAERILQKTNADILEITVAEPYPENGNDASERAISERESGNLPEINKELPDLSNYDTVLVGGPVWSGLLAPPLMNYLKQTDFGGKTVVPFWTDAGSPDDYEKDFVAQVQNGQVLKGLGLSNISSMSEDEMNSALDSWLSDSKVS